MNTARNVDGFRAVAARIAQDLALSMQDRRAA